MKKILVTYRCETEHLHAIKCDLKDHYNITAVRWDGNTEQLLWDSVVSKFLDDKPPIAAWLIYVGISDYMTAAIATQYEEAMYAADAIGGKDFTIIVGYQHSHLGGIYCFKAPHKMQLSQDTDWLKAITDYIERRLPKSANA